MTAVSALGVGGVEDGPGESEVQISGKPELHETLPQEEMLISFFITWKKQFSGKKARFKKYGKVNHKYTKICIEEISKHLMWISSSCGAQCSVFLTV